MRKILFLTALLIYSTLYAQDDPYFSITSTENYVELINPISVNEGEIWNEDSTYLINFDFDFEIYDQTFNSLIVDAGGGILFPNSGYKSIRVYHTPFGGYLLRDKGVNTSLSSIDYEVTGDEGQNIIKIQWNNAGFIQWYAASDTSDYVDFQIWIFQEDSHIELRYGSNQTDPGTYGYPDGTSDPDPGPSIKFCYDSCNNILSYYSAADDPSYDFFNFCYPNYSFIDGTPSEGISYAIIPTSQSCLSEGILFEHQSEIDSFQINYSYCTEINGDVLILGEDITNLNGLDVLTKIEGDFNIGSENYGNPNLTDITGLENLTAIDGGFYISNNYSLSSLNGLNISSIGNSLVINENESLSDISGLGSLTTIGGNLTVAWNNSLTELTGLDNINANSITDLEIHDNHSLSICEVQSICEYLSSPNGDIDIHDNDAGCMSQTEVETACISVGISNIVPDNDLSIYPNPATTEISIRNSRNVINCSIFNQLGQRLLHQVYTNNKIDVSKLDQGIYIIELNTKYQRVREKLIIER